MSHQYQNIVTFIRNLYNEPKGFIPLHAPIFQGNEKKYLDECIDTTGEKDFEEFFTENENLDLKKYENIGIIKNDSSFDCDKLNLFTTTIQELKLAKKWTKSALVNLFKTMLPNFDYEDKGKYLDSKM